MGIKEQARQNQSDAKEDRNNDGGRRTNPVNLHSNDMMPGPRRSTDGRFSRRAATAASCCEMGTRPVDTDDDVPWLVDVRNRKWMKATLKEEILPARWRWGRLEIQWYGACGVRSNSRQYKHTRD